MIDYSKEDGKLMFRQLRGEGSENSQRRCSPAIVVPAEHESMDDNFPAAAEAQLGIPHPHGRGRCFYAILRGRPRPLTGKPELNLCNIVAELTEVSVSKLNQEAAAPVRSVVSMSVSDEPRD